LARFESETNPLPDFARLSLSDSICTTTTTSDLPDLPKTCGGCNSLLQARGHVNLIDYCRAHRDNMDSNEFRSYNYLLFESEKAVAEYSRKWNKVASKEDMEDEWLRPLLRKVRRQYH